MSYLFDWITLKVIGVKVCDYLSPTYINDCYLLVDGITFYKQYKCISMKHNKKVHA